MKSMTGYGGARKANSSFRIESNLRTVNGRFLEIKPHMPRDYQSFEADIKKLVKKYLKRGNVDLYIHRRVLDASHQLQVLPQVDYAKKWLKAYQKIAKELGLKGEVRLEQLVRQSEMIQVEQDSKVSPEEKKLVLEVVEAALKKCEAERQREGRALKKELTTNIAQLEKLVEKIDQLRQKANEQMQVRLQDRLSRVDEKVHVDPQRMAQEVVLQIDRVDINEEIVRLKEHAKQFHKLFSQTKEPVGRKLDFYTQELLREVNTIGSKSQLSKQTEFVVDCKSIIERVREQVQNIE